MADQDHGEVSKETRATETDDEAQHTDIGREPTPAEEEAAERTKDSADGVEEPYRDMTEKGADAKGEGKVD